MRVHHLSCGTMRPVGADVVCHVLLLETDGGLVLVDSGIGLRDVEEPGRLGPARHLLRPVLDPAETAAHQVERLGFARADVRHVVLTHLDLDHAGGLADFPDAQVHVTAAEARGAVHAPSWRERQRYRSVQWAHGPRLVEHDADGEAWRGFAAARELTQVAPGVVLVPLPGHTRGHACVAVDTGARWVLHAGDAFFTPGSVDASAPTSPVLRAFEELVAFDRGRVHDNHRRLAALVARGEPDLLVVNAHDRGLLDAARATAA